MTDMLRAGLVRLGVGWSRGNRETGHELRSNFDLRCERSRVTRSGSTAWSPLSNISTRVFRNGSSVGWVTSEERIREMRLGNLSATKSLAWLLTSPREEN